MRRKFSNHRDFNRGDDTRRPQSNSQRDNRFQNKHFGFEYEDRNETNRQKSNSYGNKNFNNNLNDNDDVSIEKRAKLSFNEFPIQKSEGSSSRRRHSSREESPYRRDNNILISRGSIDSDHHLENKHFEFDGESSMETNRKEPFIFGNQNFNNKKYNNDQPIEKRAKFSFNDFPNQKYHGTSSKVFDFYQTKHLLSQMLQEEYSENISLKLLDPDIRIINFLNNVNNQDEEVVKNVMRITLKASENKLMESNFRDYLTLVISSNFSTKRLDTFISSELRQSLNMEMFHLVILFFKLFFQILPGLAYESIKPRVDNLLLIGDNLMLRNTIIDKEILSDLNDLKVLVEKSFPYTSKREKGTRRRGILTDNLDPPDDFRKINIFPSAEDLDLSFNEVFLRKNKMNGIYKSVDDYLDVQFRLMHEDFIQPLREGLEHFKKNLGNKGLGIRIYHNVYIINTLPAERMGIIHNLNFDSSHFQRVNWIQSKRFLYGSLLCLSSDNFKTLLFATVANRDVRELKKGIISVKFYDCEPTKSTSYTIVETTNMFESYRHVLQKLQETNGTNLCLQKYLVFAESNIALPGYLDRNRELKYVYCCNEFYPGLSERSWPRAVEFELDESQFQAFKTGLTKEIAIIQGPPGTGKTFLGLKICHCLLENVQNHIDRFGPILVVCYTNHALDQFLEGILKFTKKIIRIGNRCKSEILQEYSLSKWKRQYYEEATSKRKRKVFSKMVKIKDNLLQLQATSKLSNDCILSLEMLSPFLIIPHRKYLEKIGVKEWLSGQSTGKFPSQSDIHLDNFVEKMMSVNIKDIVKRVVIESRHQVMNGDDEDDDENDNDIEVNYINNSRSLDTDIEDFNVINKEFENIIKQMRDAICGKEVISKYYSKFLKSKSKVEKQLFKSRLRSLDQMLEEEVWELREIDSLNIKTRWKLYNYWKLKYVESVNEISKKVEVEYETHSKQLNELSFEDDRQIMMRQDIIGMTTTGAARYGRVLSQIQCKIIIVEEAAEVLESHIIGSLNPGCEHLILIGDHKQLKPNPTVYELARSYNLDLSLFERLINNHLHFNTLELQHRMRPEIADVMKFVYRNLKNHESVLKYPNVPAVSTNMFFFNHTEKETLNEEISSYSNKFEADFIVSFCLHLLKNGIENDQITILTLYSGQLFLLKSMMRSDTFGGIRVCVVDNYQGEENDIIILSLVRSNDLEKIGFLNIENRICVCLSRARHGLFVFGNFQILTNQSNLWKNICFDLKQKNLLGDKLVLLCQNHPEKRLEVRKVQDFQKYPEGGCTQVCNDRLSCGHACRKACHFLDKLHQKVMCFEPCTKSCPKGHHCLRKCWEECGNCQIPVLKRIPICNHEQFMLCYVSPESDNCANECERILKCDHKCLRLCRERCGDCLHIVRKVSPECGHEGNFYCSDKILYCSQKCNGILDCEHACAGTCGQCNMGRLHLKCNGRCHNQLICGHVCRATCSIDCPPCNKKCEEGCIHNVCPNRCGDECVPCSEECKWRCKHMRCSKKCYEKCDREICDESCLKMLDCLKCEKLFPCYGVCGEVCREICLQCDPEVKEIFFGTEDDEDAKFITLLTCGHSFEIRSMDKYMNTVIDDNEIVQKRCPKCKTVITKRSCFRYLNIVRKISFDIKEVQSRINKNYENIDSSEFIKKLEVNTPKLDALFNTLKVVNYLTTINREIMTLSKHEKSKYNNSLDMALELYSRFYMTFVTLDREEIDFQYIEKCLVRLLEWLNPAKRKFGQFDMTQYECELDRIKHILTLREIRKTYPDSQEMSHFIDELKKCTSFSKTFSNEFKKKLKAFIDEKGNLPNMGITEVERKQIVSAIGLGAGRWYKCPNGHYYVIGECGGATQIAKCSECDAHVGGENHRVRDDNQFAPEMDNARFPAFSDQANLANYVID